jgi:hypothetical protein
MLPLFSPIIAFFSKNKYNTIVTIVALAMAGMFFYQRGQTRAERFRANIAEQNFNASIDSIRQTINKAGEVEFNKLAYITDKVANLEALNSSLYAEVKRIKGSVSTIIKGEVKIVHDTVPLIVQGTLIDSIVRADFNHSQEFSPGNFRKLKGYTKYDLKTGVSGGELLQDEVGIRFTTGIKNIDKGKPEIFVASTYPGFSVTRLDGAVLDPKLFDKKKVPTITMGFGVGWTPIVYDIRSKKTTVSISQFGVSFGANINLIQLLKNK